MRILKIWLYHLIITFFAVTAAAQTSAKAPSKPTLKNIIIMISDGCGYNQIDAASLYQYGRTGVQPYENFPVRCAVSTYSAGGSYDPNKAWSSFNYVKSGYTDSAAAATAMSTGTKTHYGIIGLDVNKKPLKHLIERCEELGKATGVVTSVSISHATPAGFAAHNEYLKNYTDIANEMFYRSSLEVIMGAGHPMYDDDNKFIIKPDDSEYKYIGGRETWADLSDGKLVGADADGDSVADDWTVIHKLSEFEALANGPTPKRVIGLAQVKSTLQQKRSGDSSIAFAVPFNQNVPTLAQMTKAAINVLDDDPNGLFLMVEGGAIDWAGHDNQSGRMIEEEIDFNKAVEAVLEWVSSNSNWDETLVIVTGDHETGYLTGPDSGKKESGPVWNPLINNGQGKMPGMQWNSKDHTNSLIPFFAKGSGADLFKDAAANTDSRRGNYIDNTDIAKVIFSLLN